MQRSVMARHLTLIGLVGALVFSTPTLADLKCGDAPYKFDDDGLVVTWIGPVPKDARVRYVDGELFERFNRQLGPEIPREWPEKYQKDLRYVEMSNAQMSTSIEEATSWLKRFEIPMEPEPTKVFQRYLERGNLIFSTLLEHPPVEEASAFVACSIILQRAILVMTDDRETMYLRSYFHSSNGKGTAVNFAPAGGLRISFPSKVAWFPLELTRFITEPAAYVVLDIVTPRPVKVAAPAPFKSVASDVKVDLGAQDYYVTRLSGVLEGGKEWPDLALELTR